MGLKIKKELPDGSFSEYFNISRADVYLREQIVDVYISGFVSLEKRTEGKTPNLSMCERYIIPTAKNGITISEIYGLLKTNDFFIGAEDI